MPQIRHIDFYSHVLGRNLKVEITGHWGYPILMFPTTKGQYLQNRDFGLNASAKCFTNSGKVKLYNIETLDAENLYAYHISPHDRIYHYHKYMQFLHEEFIPYMQRENSTHRIAVAGCSFGGFHAANTAFRFPDLVSHLFSMSGAFSIRNFAPIDNEMVYYNCPEEFMASEEAWKYNHMNIVLGTSDWDICLDKNQNMAKILSSKGIDFWFDEKKWAQHDWALWCRQFPEYLGAYFG